MRALFTSAVASSSKNPHIGSSPRQSLRLFTSTSIAWDDEAQRGDHGDRPAFTPPLRGKSFGLKSSSPRVPNRFGREKAVRGWGENEGPGRARRPSRGVGSGGAEAVKQISSDLESRHSESIQERSNDFKNLFKLLRQKPSDEPGSMASRLQIDFKDSGPPPKPITHSRFNRAGGVTPHEATAFNKVIADVLNTFPDSDRQRSNPYAGPAAPYQPTPYNAQGGAVPAALNNVGRERAANLRGIFGKINKDDEATLEEFDLLSEEMDVIGNDAELLQWAKERVFKPVRGGEAELGGSSNTMPVFPATTNTPSSTSQGEPSPLLEYRLAYSKIIARLLRTFRVHYNQPHLVLSLFEHVKTTSVESYMQGCSTEVYNEMLITRWECFRDLEGIYVATNEMDVMGVPWDQHTMQVVNAAVTTVSQEGMQPGNTRWSERDLVISAQLDKQVEKDVVTEERFTAFARKQKDRLRYEMGASALPAEPELDEER